MKEGIHPVNLTERSCYVSATKVLVKKSEGRYIVDVSDTNAEVIAIGVKSNDNSVAKFKKLMNKLYDLDLEGY